MVVRNEHGGNATRAIDRLLSIYLNDHLAGSALGLQLARRTLASNRGTPLGDFLERFLREVIEDRRTLEGLMERVGAPKSRLKPLLAVGAERAGRLKLNGRLRGYSPLSRVVELEGLVTGVTGKRAMWRALGTLDHEPALREFDFRELERRADAQLAVLEEHRLEAAGRAFTGSPAA